jgi:curli production assembly/transport component CsgF
MTKVLIPWVLTLAASGVHATELVYEPVNPSFGGNPLNGAFLLNNAQAQNDLKDPDTELGSESQTDLERFNDMLQRSILSRISASMSSSLFDANGELVPGTLETSDFVIDIVDLGDGVLRITTTDKNTGASSSFEISNAI